MSGAACQPFAATWVVLFVLTTVKQLRHAAADAARTLTPLAHGCSRRHHTHLATTGTYGCGWRICLGQNDATITRVAATRRHPRPSPSLLTPLRAHYIQLNGIRLHRISRYARCNTPLPLRASRTASLPRTRCHHTFTRTAPASRCDSGWAMSYTMPPPPAYPPRRLVDGCHTAPTFTRWRMM